MWYVPFDGFVEEGLAEDVVEVLVGFSVTTGFEVVLDEVVVDVEVVSGSDTSGPSTQ